MSTSLQKYLSRLTPSELNTFILHLSRLLSTSAGVEASLSTALFALTLLHSQLTLLLHRQYTSLAHALTTKPSPPSVRDHLTANLSAPQTNLLHTSTSTKQLALTARETWTVLRLLNLPHIYKWARDTHAHPPRDPIIKLLTWAQILSATTCQAAENVAFLASKDVLPGAKWERRAPRLFALSYRFWLAKCVLDLLRLGRVRQLRWEERLGAEREGEKEVEVQSEALKRKWTRQVWTDAGWLGVMFGWSFVGEGDGPVSEVWEGVSGLVPSVVMLQDAWRESA